MDFGITLKPDHRFDRSVDLAKRAEANGFGYNWIFDSHVLWRDPYPLLTLIGAATERMRLGTCVTNPATRDITVTASALAIEASAKSRALSPRVRPRASAMPRSVRCQSAGRLSL